MDGSLPSFEERIACIRFGHLNTSLTDYVGAV
jgi:hypothetical protein